MITIINTGEIVGKKAKYIVKINNEVVTEFLHERKDGLGVCLLEASKSVDKKKWRELKDLLNYKKPGGDTPG
ncbi:MAG: hypothetical protein IPJ03_17385 [Ignavibacteriales bacterium]|nr:hypothetical protein [Ignavibacteriales bacterium]MBK7380733.1 hypothetical protein [Ignavibacteriales bacterium]